MREERNVFSISIHINKFEYKENKLSNVLKVEVTYGDLYGTENGEISDLPYNLMWLSKGYFKVEDLHLCTPCEAHIGDLHEKAPLVKIHTPHDFKMEVEEIGIQSTLDYDASNSYKYISKKFMDLFLPVPRSFLGGCMVDFKVVSNSGKNYQVRLKASS